MAVARASLRSARATAYGGTTTRPFGPRFEGASVDADRACPHHCSNVTPPSNKPPAPTASLFSMLLHCSRLVYTISLNFHRGGTKPEVVFPTGSRCCRRVFQVAVDRLRLAQSSETSSTAPEYYFRLAAATLDFRPNRLAEQPRVPISRGTPLAHRQPLRNRWRCLRSSWSKSG